MIFFPRVFLIAQVLFSLFVFADPNTQGWQLLMENKPNEAREIFLKNIGERDPAVAGEAFRGLSEVCDFIGNDNDAVNYFFKSGIVEKNPALLSAGILSAYQFTSGATGASLKDGYTLLKMFAERPGIYSGEFQDLLAARLLNNGDIRAARSIINSMGCIRDYMMIGPFDNISNAGFNKPYPPESEIDFSKQYPGKDGNLTRWNRIENTAATGWVYTENHSNATNAAIYFYCTVTSDRTRSVNLSFGASGAFKIFLNGNLTIADSVFRNTGIDMYMQRVTLEKGANTLLIKLCHESGNAVTGTGRLSNFNVRLLEENFSPVKGLSFGVGAPKAQAGNREKPGYSSLAPSPLADSILFPLTARLKKNENDLDAALLCMHAYNGMEKTDDGQILAAKFLMRYPKSSLWHVLYGESLVRAKKFTESQTEKKTAYTLCPLNRAAWLYELQTIIKTSDPRKILEFIANSPAGFAGSLSALLAATNAHLELGNKAEANKNIALIEQKHLSDNLAVSVIAALYKDQGEVRKAQKIISNYLKYDRTNVAMYKILATISLNQGDIAKSIGVLLDALDYSPNSADLYYFIANVYYSAKKLKKAQEYVEKACAIMPADANTLNLKGNILVSLNERDNAMCAFNDAIQLTSDDFNAWENLRVLQKKPTLESLAPLPPVDSLIRLAKGWPSRENEDGAILCTIEDVFFYPSRCSRQRSFMVVYLPTQQAIDTWKEKNIGYNNYYQDLSVERAFSTTAAGVQTQADVLENKIVFKSLTPGDYIVVEWSLKNYFNGDMAPHVYGEEDFQWPFPVFDGRLRLITPLADTIPYSVFGDSIMVSSTPRDDYRVTQLCRAPYKNPIEESFEPDDWPGRRKVTYSTFGGWGDIVKWYEGLTRHKLDNTLELKALADSLFAKCKTPIEKVAGVHRYVTGNIRYSYAPFRQSNWIPQDAHDVLSTKIGDCKDMASLGKSLLDYAGIPSCLVLVNTGVSHSLEHAFIGPNFNHCILCYTLDKKDRFMDLTDNNLSLGPLPKDDQGAMALIIRPGEKALIALPFDKPGARIKRRTIISSVSDSGLFKEHGETMRTGIFAGQYREIFRFQSNEKKQSIMHGILAHYYPDFTLDSFAIDSSLNTLSDSLHYTYAFTAKNAVTFSGATAIVPLHVPDNIEPDECPVENKRHFPVEMSRTDYDNSTLEAKGELTFPKRWKPISLPQTVSLTSPWGAYSLAFQRKGNSIVYVRKALFHFNALVHVTDYEQLKSFLSSISKADAVQLLFYTTAPK
jgi:tetratricopeptide (TPR) repeat protein